MSTSMLANRPSYCLAIIARHLVRLRADRRGNVAVMAGLLMAPLIGAMGVGFEISNWYLAKRAMQNAADAAAIAAATNGGSNYTVEAKAVTPHTGINDRNTNTTVYGSNTH